ncbi:hypothetical protein HK104_003193, partial [Borealophlyctis nickersoniae]
MDWWKFSYRGALHVAAATKSGAKSPIRSADLDSDPRLASVPIYLVRIDGHASWANGKVLAIAAKVLPSDPGKVEGGEIVLGSDGKPTGIFVDNAMSFVGEQVQPIPDEEQRSQQLELATKEMLKYGLTGIHDAGVDPADLPFLQRAVDLGRLPVRMYAMILCRNQTGYCGDRVPEDLLHKNYGGRLYVRSAKLMLDGALGSWGAAMIKGFQVNIHAIGDFANKLVLDAFEGNMQRWDKEARQPRGADLRLRIEHAQIMTLPDVYRTAKLGVIPSVQPTHCTSDMSYVESRIGKRAEGAYIWKTFLDAGVHHLPLGSDFPIERVNPLLGIYAAVTRKAANGTSPHGPDGWHPREKLSPEEALRGFTLDAAYASFQEEQSGSIAVGKLADFAVFDRDFLAAASTGTVEGEQSILQAKCVATVVDGVVAYGGL